MRSKADLQELVGSWKASYKQKFGSDLTDELLDVFIGCALGQKREKFFHERLFTVPEVDLEQIREGIEKGVKSGGDIPERKEEGDTITPSEPIQAPIYPSSTASVGETLRGREAPVDKVEGGTVGGGQKGRPKTGKKPLGRRV